MRTKPVLVRAAVVLVIFGSTLGTRHPAAAEVLPFETVPSVVTPAEGPPLPAPPRAEYRAADEAIAAELERQTLEAERLAAEAAEAARLAAEQAAANWHHWVLDVTARIASRTGRWLPYETVSWVIGASLRHGVDPVLVGRIGACESGGRADAYNPSGASGFGQHLAAYWPARAAGAGFPGASPFDLWTNIEVTAWYLARAGTTPWNPSKHCWG